MKLLNLPIKKPAHVAVQTGRNEPVVRRLEARRGSLGISVLAEPCTPSRNYTSQAPGSIEYRFN